MKHNTARDFFLTLLSTVVLYVTLGGLLTVLFQSINAAIPDAASGYYAAASIQSALRTGMAMLIVAAPIYVWSVWYAASLLRAGKTPEDSKIRKWLQYLTVFVAAVIIIVTLITLVVQFLNGDLTLRVGLKILATLLASVVMFVFYLKELPAKGAIARQQQVSGAAGLVLIIATIVFGFFFLDSPATVRAQRVDQERVNALQSMYWDLEEYYYANGELPSSDEESDFSFHVGYTDPVTGDAYEYNKTGENSFELCATYDTASDTYETAVRSQVAPHFKSFSWDHPAGYYCHEGEFRPDVTNNQV